MPSAEILMSRRHAAEAAKDYFSKKISWLDFINEFGEVEDEAIGALVDLIEHEPKRGGLLGVSEKDWEQYQLQLTQAVEALNG